MNDKEKAIRERAYRLWEAEGRPHGREAEHWERAHREYEANAGQRPADQPAGVAPLGGVEPALDTAAAERPSSRAKAPAKSAAANGERKPGAKRPGKSRTDSPKR